MTLATTTDDRRPGPLIQADVNGEIKTVLLPAQMLVNSAGVELGTSTGPIVTASGALTAGTDRSGSITTGGTAQALAIANASRLALFGQNISAEDMWINEIGGTAAANTAGSYKIAAGNSFSISTNRAVSVVAATTGSKFTATEL